MLDNAVVVMRLLAGILALGYLAWRDWPLALAVLLVADLSSWLSGRRALVGPRKGHS